MYSLQDNSVQCEHVHRLFEWVCKLLFLNIQLRALVAQVYLAACLQRS